MELNFRILCIRGRCLHRRRRKWVRGSEEPKNKVKDYDALTLNSSSHFIYTATRNPGSSKNSYAGRTRIRWGIEETRKC